MVILILWIVVKEYFSSTHKRSDCAWWMLWCAVQILTLWMKHSFCQPLGHLAAKWSKLSQWLTNQEFKSMDPLPECGHLWKTVLAPVFPGGLVLIFAATALHFSLSSILLCSLLPSPLPHEAASESISQETSFQEICLRVSIWSTQHRTVWLVECWNFYLLAQLKCQILMSIIHAFTLTTYSLRTCYMSNYCVSFSEFFKMHLFLAGMRHSS